MKKSLICTMALLAMSFIATTNVTAGELEKSGVTSYKHVVNRAKPGIIPTPQEITWGGKEVVLKNIKIKIKSDKVSSLTKQSLESCFEEKGVKTAFFGKFSITLEEAKMDVPRNADEAYTLEVTSKGAVIKAQTTRGFFYGVQTLRQLIVSEGPKTTIAQCSIKDYPAFKIRGFMHDVGRNFISLDLLKKQIDLMSLYKYNVFHWHLSDNHGWRLESKAIPELQGKGAFLRFEGKYYTQKEFVEFVDYCAERQIMVIPELDSPGHTEVFRKVLGLKTMNDQRANDAIVKLMDELCSLVPKEKMPYIHVGTDEVKGHERPNGTYIKDLYDVLVKNDRKVIGWHRGINAPKGYEQTQQTWAEVDPRKGVPHIDSRGNYINHIDHLTCLTFMLFQQPCRQPYGSDMDLGGIICYWPDIYAPDENLSMLNSPVWQVLVSYPEAVWTGVKKNDSRYWSTIPSPGTEEGKHYRNMENRMVEHRERHLKSFPFPFVASAHIPWRILGPMEDGQLKEIDQKNIQKEYTDGDKKFTWSNKVYYGGTLELRHSFAQTRMPYGGHFAAAHKANPKLNKVYAYTQVYSPKDQTVDCWIAFNTISASDDRSGAMITGQWNRHKMCKVWLNGEEVLPPEWKNPKRSGREIPLTDEVYVARKPSKITLKKGWNTVVYCAARSWKWQFTFCPIKIEDGQIKEVEGLKYSADFGQK